MNYEQLKMIRSTTDEQLIEIALRLFAYDNALFMSLNKGDVLQVRTAWNNETYTITKEQLEKIKSAKSEYGSTKVAMIKVARTMFDIGLKEAKELVEQMQREGHITYEPYDHAPNFPTSYYGSSYDYERTDWTTGMDDRLT